MNPLPAALLVLLLSALAEGLHARRVRVAARLAFGPEGASRGWTKLATFSQDLHGLKGTALFLDVDVVITGSLDDFFAQPGEFLIIHDYKRPWRITGILGTGGMGTVYKAEHRLLERLRDEDLVDCVLRCGMRTRLLADIDDFYAIPRRLRAPWSGPRARWTKSARRQSRTA